MDNPGATARFIFVAGTLLVIAAFGVLLGVFLMHSDLDSINSNLGSINSDLSQPVPGDGGGAVAPQLRTCTLPEHSRP